MAKKTDPRYITPRTEVGKALNAKYKDFQDFLQDVYKHKKQSQKYRMVRFKQIDNPRIGYWLWKQSSAPGALSNIISMVISQYGYSDWLQDVVPSLEKKSFFKNHSNSANINIKQPPVNHSQDNSREHTRGDISSSSSSDYVNKRTSSSSSSPRKLKKSSIVNESSSSSSTNSSSNTKSSSENKPNEIGKDDGFNIG